MNNNESNVPKIEEIKADSHSSEENYNDKLIETNDDPTSRNIDIDTKRNLSLLPTHNATPNRVASPYEINSERTGLLKDSTIYIKSYNNSYLDANQFMSKLVNPSITFQEYIEMVTMPVQQSYKKMLFDLCYIKNEYLLKFDNITILKAVKKKWKINSEYQIYSYDNLNIIGVVKSNFLGTNFVFYDNGLNPKDKNADIKNIREEQGAVIYESDIFGRRPRKLLVLLPKADEEKRKIWKPHNEMESLIYSNKQKGCESMALFYNKQPQWVEQYQCHLLDFNGRIKIPSCKNFQLSYTPDGEKVMQFGKVTNELYHMDIQFPFSIAQAFCICLSSIDKKRACR